MPIAPLHEPLVEIHEPLDDLSDRRIFAVDVNKDALHVVRRLDRQRHVATEQRRWHFVAVGAEVMQERIPQRRLRKPCLHALAVRTALRIPLERRPAFLAEYEFDLAKLMGLETASRLEPIPKREKVKRRHLLEHVDLRDQRFQNRQDALERCSGERRVVGAQQLLEIIQLVQHFLEPQLIDLVDDDEQGLVMLERTRTWLLEREQLFELQVTRVRDRHQAGLGRYWFSVAYGSGQGSG